MAPLNPREHEIVRKSQGCFKSRCCRFACSVQMHRSQLKDMMKEKKARKIELDRSAGAVRPFKFEVGRMAPGDEQKLRPFEYVGKLG